MQSANSNLAVEFFESAYRTSLKLPLVTANVCAGFPSPADDYIDGAIDLNEELISNPTATFYARVQGDSMVKAGIHAGDLLVVDRSVTAEDKAIVVACINGEFTVKRMKFQGKRCFLVPESDQFQPIEITDGMDFEVFGVVTSVVRKLR